MSCQSILERGARALILAGGLLASAVPAGAAPQNILPFGANTWDELGRSPLRPMVLVFSATDCAHCPAAITRMAEAIRKFRSQARLIVVVTDGAGQEAALRREPHYRHADVLYAFDGDGTALRYTVNPDWRGLTPYVALVPAAGRASFHAGSPPPDALRAFLARQK